MGAGLLLTLSDHIGGRERYKLHLTYFNHKIRKSGEF